MRRTQRWHPLKRGIMSIYALDFRYQTRLSSALEVSRGECQLGVRTDVKHGHDQDNVAKGQRGSLINHAGTGITSNASMQSSIRSFHPLW